MAVLCCNGLRCVTKIILSLSLLSLDLQWRLIFNQLSCGPSSSRHSVRGRRRLTLHVISIAVAIIVFITLQNQSVPSQMTMVQAWSVAWVASLSKQWMDTLNKCFSNIEASILQWHSDHAIMLPWNQQGFACACKNNFCLSNNFVSLTKGCW